MRSVKLQEHTMMNSCEGESIRCLLLDCQDQIIKLVTLSDEQKTTIHPNKVDWPSNLAALLPESSLEIISPYISWKHDSMFLSYGLSEDGGINPEVSLNMYHTCRNFIIKFSFPIF